MVAMLRKTASDFMDVLGMSASEVTQAAIISTAIPTAHQPLMGRLLLIAAYFTAADQNVYRVQKRSGETVEVSPGGRFPINELRERLLFLGRAQ